LEETTNQGRREEVERRKTMVMNDLQSVDGKKVEEDNDHVIIVKSDDIEEKKGCRAPSDSLE
jgi:hypothetical protein